MKGKYFKTSKSIKYYERGCRCKLDVQNIDLIEKSVRRDEDSQESNLNRRKISNWLWMNHQHLHKDLLKADS